MTNKILGVDISKKTFDVALLTDKKTTNKKFDNSQKGFDMFIQWLKNKEIDTAHVCMEATGSYSLPLAEYLHDRNFKVSVVNPACVKSFAQSRLSRVKTDKSDSNLIAEFCQTMKPEPWKPSPLHVRELQQLVNRLDSLIAIKNQETNRLEVAGDIVKTNIKSVVTFLDEQIEKIEKLISEHIKNHTDLSDKEKLLASIPGVGDKTIAIVLAFLSNIEEFSTPKQVVAFLGLNPKIRQSGTSVNGYGRISKTGKSDLRKAFYMPALTSLRYNPIIKKFAERLDVAGKAKMVIVVAAMRKLIHIIYGVLKNQTLFNENIETLKT